MPADRTIHARTATSVVVRYDRSGKYYEEFPDEPGRTRRPLTVQQAAQAAASGTVYLKQPGGMRFDAEYAKLASHLSPDANQDR